MDSVLGKLFRGSVEITYRENVELFWIVILDLLVFDRWMDCLFDYMLDKDGLQHETKKHF